MEKYVIKGGNVLEGEVSIAGAKNAALGILAAAVMTDEECIIENVPYVEDTKTLLRAIETIGAKVKYIDNHTVSICGGTIRTGEDVCVDDEYIRKIRASYYLLGALLGKYNYAQVALPGGCDIGLRPIDQHIKGFEALGAKVEIVNGGKVVAKADQLIGNHIYLDVVTVGATINIMMAAVLAEGKTTIENAAKEPHIVDVANFLNSMGANIKGAGTDVIRIRGVQKLRGTEYSIIPDQIEAGTFMTMAAATKGNVLIKNVIPKHLEAISSKLNEIGARVIEYDDAVRVISGAIRRSRAGISSPKHPVGSFIFLGPTGVGKTQLAKALAKYLFGSEDSLIRIDMSDFMEKHTASRLVGAPPGYVGYEDGGILTEKVRRHPYSVVLLDEIEKAHPDIFNLLLQLLEEGELSDNLGHTVNFRNTVIIMTSNAGARQITNEGRVGFGTLEGVMPYQEIKSGAMHELKKLLNPELINRIDDVIVFNALSKAEISKILDIQIKDLSDRISGKNLTIKIDEDAKAYLIEHGYNPAMGARPMKRLIRKEIEDPLAMAILENSDKKLSCVYVELKDGKLNITLGEKEKEPVLQLVGKKSVIK